MRPSLIFFFEPFKHDQDWQKVGSVRAVRTKVGQIVLTLILWGPNSIAIALVNPSTACFVAQ